MRWEIKLFLQANIPQKYSRQKIIKIGQYLTMLQLITDGGVFLTHGVDFVLVGMLTEENGYKNCCLFWNRV